MLRDFLEANRSELIARCRAKVALRPAPRPTPHEMEHGIPLFLAQLIETLRSEGKLPPAPASPPRDVPAELEESAIHHGRELLQQGFTVNQVVHDYGDLCQAVTELAVEKHAHVSPGDFNVLNRCLDNAIADAVTEFARERDEVMQATGDRAMSERLGFLAHELRNFLNTAMLSFAAIKSGGVGLNGATSAVLDRSLVGLRELIDRTLADVRLAAGTPAQREAIAVDRFIAEVQVAASLDARSRGCGFTVFPVDSALVIEADKQILYSAVSNLLQNAFKFTRPHGNVTLKAHGVGDRVHIDVQDQCGGLPEGKAEALFKPFEQRGADRTGLGLGLSIALRAVEASDGQIRVRDLPGTGCVFTIDLPRRG